MQKLNKKGFFLVETLIVVGIAATVLVLFYRQISNIYKHYENSVNYDTVQAIHADNNIKKFIDQEGKSALITALGSNDYLDITSYAFTDADFYTQLKTVSHIDKIYFTKYNLNSLIDDISSTNFSASFIRYLKTLKLIDTTNTANKYRIIIKLKDGSYSNIVIDNRDAIKPVLTLLGATNIDVYVGSSYTDAGAAASDNIDGNITANIVPTSNLNMNEVGTYKITYNVVDSSGNNAVSVTRTINVLPVGYLASEGVNMPKLASGMKAVKWNGSKWINVNNPLNDSSWYNYSNKEWANAVSLDRTKTVDYSSNENIGTIAGATQSTDGMTFDGVDDSILASSALNSYNFNQTITIAVRFKLLSFNSSVNQALIGNWENGGGGIYVSTTNYVTFEIYIGGAYRTVSSTTPIQLNTFYTVVCTYNGSAMKIYINGTLANSTSINGVIGPSVYSFAVGANPNGSGTFSAYSNALVSDTAIYTSALADQDISTNYAGSVNMIKTNLLVGYKLVENIDDGTIISVNNMNAMWVWIPRYIYKISSGWHSSTTGTIDVQFSIGTDDTRDGTVSVDTGTTSEASNNKWTNHPAFTFGTTELTGIWVAKFEPTAAEGVASSASACNAADNVTTKNIKIIPNATSWRCINMSNSYTLSRNMETNSIYGWGTSGSGVDTHQMKNTEWGVVAYLARSIYGKNAEIWVNNSGTYTTGCAGNNASEAQYASGCQNTYSATNGLQASTTGTIYGVYDMSGGAIERVMGNYASTGTTESGITNVASIPSKYINIYTGYDVNIKGDAVYETGLGAVWNGSAWVGSGTGSWYLDSSYMPYSTIPWLQRGNTNTGGTGAGIFAYSYSYGELHVVASFRPVLLVESGL